MISKVLALFMTLVMDILRRALSSGMLYLLDMLVFPISSSHDALNSFQSTSFLMISEVKFGAVLSLALPSTYSK